MNIIIPIISFMVYGIITINHTNILIIIIIIIIVIILLFLLLFCRQASKSLGMTLSMKCCPRERFLFINYYYYSRYHHIISVFHSPTIHQLTHLPLHQPSISPNLHLTHLPSHPFSISPIIHQLTYPKGEKCHSETGARDDHY